MIQIQQWSQKRFYILIWIVAVAGVTQGMLIPLLTILLEKQGMSATQNGLGTSMLYVGMLIMTPLSAKVVRKVGYRTAIAIGLLSAAICMFLFPYVTGFWVWILLRVLVGAGDSLLHFTTQLWITSTCPDDEKGKRISLYGFSYSLGFGIGPLFLKLLPYGLQVPFIAVGLLMAITVPLMMRLEGGRTTFLSQPETSKEKLRLSMVYRVGLIALCPPILYAFLETALAGNFPIIGLRSNLSADSIAYLIGTFVWGSLLFQVPLGILSQKWGRKNLLMTVCLLGGLGMLMIPYLMGSMFALVIAFGLVGGLVGSLFSLGLTYLTDLLPKRYLPLGNAVAGMHFSCGSIAGPYLGSFLIQGTGGNGLFYFLGGSLLAFVILAIVYPVREAIRLEPSTSIEKQAS
ncbi:MFS family permease [Croceifilum oryzae]|uniref:MFS family permease n=1 Tax=Croceifilum oryzae TaxID=1553429 RepID=A0AAJ1TDW5_9BACL|nr:MFS transporter [Croceifilum oryzae]MDQ0416604.1 MFS family permease [Croceifilum oryzae]